MKSFDILFSILTLPEVDFLAPVAARLIERGNSVGFILFHEAGAEKLQAMGIPCFNIFEMIDKASFPRFSGEEIEEIRLSFGIDNLRHLFIHEKMGYDRKDEDALAQKVAGYLLALDSIFRDHDVKCVIQELGGFSSNQCVYHAARKHGIDHVFYEPAPFPRRIVFNLNSYYSDIPEEVLAKQVDGKTNSEVEAYVERYCQQKNLVIPFKDKHSFADMTLGKIFNSSNARKLKRKLFHKYVQKKREEYDEIGWVIRFNFLKLIRRLLLASSYSEPDLAERFVYFPFHVPHDIQLTSRSRLFYNQEAFVEYLARILPYGCKLYIKEHPASIGGHSSTVLKKVLKQHNNVQLIHPRTNSFDLIRHAELVISVNSKVGFEAIMQGKKVLVVGDAFYKRKGVTFDSDNLNNLEPVLRDALEASSPDQGKVTDFLTKAYAWSYPCELFLMEETNLETSIDSFISYLESGRFNRLGIK
ncbi:MAG: hypothetical protein HYS23_03235 [Geobacter sp.]|nr:hypothetical protein [Geobacter sp.]